MKFLYHIHFKEWTKIFPKMQCKGLLTCSKVPFVVAEKELNWNRDCSCLSTQILCDWLTVTNSKWDFFFFKDHSATVTSLSAPSIVGNIEDKMCLFFLFEKEPSLLFYQHQRLISAQLISMNTFSFRRCQGQWNFDLSGAFVLDTQLKPSKSKYNSQSIKFAF